MAYLGCHPVDGFGLRKMGDMLIVNRMPAATAGRDSDSAHLI